MGMKKALPGATNTEEGKEGSRLCDGLALVAPRCVPIRSRRSILQTAVVRLRIPFS